MLPGQSPLLFSISHRLCGALLLLQILISGLVTGMLPMRNAFGGILARDAARTEPVTFFHIPPLMRCPAFITDPYLRARDGYAPDAKCLWWHSRSGCCPDRARQRIPDKKGRRICGSPTNYTFSPLSAAALAAALDSKYSA